MTSIASERSLTRTRASTLPPGWQVYAMFISLLLAWPLGLANFVWPVIGVFLVFNLLTRGRAAVPPGFGIWLLFLAWMLVSGLTLESTDRVLAFIYRGSFYLAATALFLYLFNAPEHRIPSRAIINALALYWGAVVIGGFLGVAFPGASFQSLGAQLIESALPANISNVQFIHDIVNPEFAQVQRILGFPVGRPKTFFSYTNEWGSMLVLLTPFALLAARYARSTLARYLIVGLLLVSFIPLAVSLNRGAWLGLLVVLAYAALRFAVRGNVRALAGLIALTAVTGVVIASTPLSGLIESRLETPHSDEARESRDVAVIELVAKESPVFGFGAPQPTEEAGAPSLGTHGQLFLVLISTGIPGVILFFSWFLFSFMRTRSSRSPTIFWTNAVVLAFFVLSLFYELVAFQLPVVMAALALAWRELAGPRADGPARAQPRRITYRTRPVPLPAPPRPAQAAKWPDAAGELVGDPLTTPDLSRSDLATVARGGALSLLGGIAFGIFGFLLVFVVSHGLGADGAGLFLEAVALFMIGSRIAQLGADVGVVRNLPRFRALERTADIRRTLPIALVPVFVVASVFALALVVFAPDIAAFAVREGDPDKLASFLRLWAPFLVLASVTAVVLAAARGLGWLVPFVSIENVGKPALQPLLAFVCIALGLGTTALAFAWAVPIGIGFVAACAWLVVLLRRVERADRSAEETPRPTRVLAREFWGFSTPRAFASFFQVIVAWSDIILVGALASARAAGIYAAASRFAVMGTLVLRALIVVIGPQISTLLAREQRARAQTVYQTSTWWLTAASWPLYLLLAIFSPLVLSIFGEEFVSGHVALTILASAMLVSMACGPVSVVLLMGGKSSWNLYNTILSATVGIGLSVVLTPKYGIEGAAIAAATAVVLNNIVPLVQVWLSMRLHPLGFGFGVVAASALATFGGLGLLARVTFGPSALAFLLAAGAATILYLALLNHFRHTLQLRVIRDVLKGRRRQQALEGSERP